jgi:hypothetical protein
LLRAITDPISDNGDFKSRQSRLEVKTFFDVDASASRFTCEISSATVKRDAYSGDPRFSIQGTFDSDKNNNHISLVTLRNAGLDHLVTKEERVQLDIQLEKLPGRKTLDFFVYSRVYPGEPDVILGASWIEANRRQVFGPDPIIVYNTTSLELGYEPPGTFYSHALGRTKC